MNPTSVVSESELRILREAFYSKSKQNGKEELFNYVYALVQSDKKAHNREALNLINSNGKLLQFDDDRDTLYLKCVCLMKLQFYSESLELLDGILLQREPKNKQFQDLKMEIVKRTKEDGLIGLSIVGGLVAAVVTGGLLAAKFMSKNKGSR
ncbi:hypothetical protein MP638_006695 [Amoeboaphelidium occidentale]|nr:hypothetical protein MP638_006695 [Amoeboaphelidium occidentale]